MKKKPVGRVFNEALSKFIHKCNFDVEITVDALGMISDYETFILGSGDGDFVKLVKYLKGKQKRVIVLSWGDRINSHLKKSASQLILLTEIKKNIEYLKRSEEQQSLGL